MISTHSFLKILGDDYTPVRAQDGTLLGAIPRIPETAETVINSKGVAFELRIAAQVCVCVAPTQEAASLDGFIGLHDATAAATAAADTINETGTDPDIGRPV